MPPRKKPAETASAEAPKLTRTRSTTPRVKKTAPVAGSAVEQAKPTRSRKKATAPTSVAPADPIDSGPSKKEYDLVIVESPAKAKTINKYLGPHFNVQASYGHVRDLPKSGKQNGEEVIGVQITNHWNMRYVVQDKVEKKAGDKGNFNRKTQKEILEGLRAAAAKANRIYLASDPDREGEAIAWHIADELRLDPKRTFRIRFNEITRSAVQQALQNATSIDLARVRAQEARRALDRVVGYPLSDLLGSKVTRGLSAGRVQSVAVKLIVDREREIEKFQSEEYWRIQALLAPPGLVVGYIADPKKSKIYSKKRPATDNAEAKEAKEPSEAEADDTGDGKEAAKPLTKLPPNSFLAELVKWNGADLDLKNEASADTILTALQTAPFLVTKIEQKDRLERPQPPFTTSTLQQQANIRLGFQAVRTMQNAQKLYEGIDLGPQGSVALITYMRTDSTRISDDALRMVRAHIQNTYGPSYLPASANSYANGKSAQEAHEAIRPTDLNQTPASVAPYLTPDQLRLYTLIYNRFVASQMTPAVFAVTNVEIVAGAGLFRAVGRIEKFDGYRRVLPPAGKQDEVELPPLREQQPLDRLDLFGSQHFTQPPPRYNEASLVRQLEKEGIGRPSTYASIISTIQARKYVELEQRRFKATAIGKLVTDLLVEHFPHIMDLKFTSKMEDDLDQIETGKTQYEQVLNDFWGPFRSALDQAKDKMPKQNGIETGEQCPKCGRPMIEMFSKQKGDKFVGCSGYRDKENPCKYIKPRPGEPETREPVLTDIPCPSCGKMMLRRFSPKKNSEFLGCSGYPECKSTMDIGPDGRPIQTTKPTVHVCEKCGKPMVIREGRRGPFLACTGYPKCKNAVDVDAAGNPVRPADTGETCDKCGSPMIIKKGPRGPFLSCSAYPKCRNAKPLTAALKEKLKDALPPPPKKEAAPVIEVAEACPLCGAAMKVRKGFKGPFLGCSKYPKCKGTREASPELIARLAEAR